MVARAALPAGGAGEARTAATQARGATQLFQGTLRVTAAGCERSLGYTQKDVGDGEWEGLGLTLCLLTLALGVAVVARAAVVTMGAAEARFAQAMSLLVTAVGQGPHQAATAH